MLELRRALARKILTPAALALGLAAGTATVARAEYPERPVTIVVPYSAGGATDIAARLIAEALQEKLNQTFIVENKPGAAGNIGAEYVANQPADGYTFLVVGAAHVINRSLYAQLNYDLKTDFVPVATISTAPLVLLTNEGTGFKTVADLVNAAKADPNALNYCSAGNGTAPHLAMEWLKQTADFKAVHIPYKGSAPGITDLVGGQVDACFDSLVVWNQYAGSGKLRALAITGSERSPIAPDVPTLAEAGYPDVDAAVWYALAAPAGTPDAVVQKINTTVDGILKEPAVLDRLKSLGASPLVMTPGDFASFLDAQISTWAKVVETSGATVN